MKGQQRTVQPLNNNVKMIKNDLGTVNETLKITNWDVQKTMLESKKSDTKQSATNVQQRQHVQGKEGSKVANNACSGLMESLAIQVSDIHPGCS
jgi:PAB1-binding protein PBP1